MRQMSEYAIMLCWKVALGDGNKRLIGESPLPDKSVIATKDSWKTNEMPEARLERPCAIDLTLEQYEIIKRGHIPEVMEDHWFMYCDTEAKEFRYYRSWSGDCIFIAKYVELKDAIVITSVVFNRDPKQNQWNGDENADGYLFQALLHCELGLDDGEWLRHFAMAMGR